MKSGDAGGVRTPRAGALLQRSRPRSTRWQTPKPDLVSIRRRPVIKNPGS